LLSQQYALLSNSSLALVYKIIVSLGHIEWTLKMGNIAEFAISTSDIRV
jgi:hypothetical protein